MAKRNAKLKAKRGRQGNGGSAPDNGGSPANNAVDLRSTPIDLDSDLGRRLVVDLARYRETLLDEKTIRKRHRLADDVWEKLAGDDELVRAVEEESARRVRDGSSKREKSQQIITRAPAILDGIMSAGSDVSPRHKIDAIRTLDTFAANPGASTPDASDRFIITINLGNDTATYNKSIKPLEPGEVDPHDVDSANVIAAIAIKPRESGGGGHI